MLNRMTPEQVSKFWDIIRYGIEQSLPPIATNDEDKMAYLLSCALSGKVDVWASYVKEDEKIKFEGIVVTRLLYDDVSNTRNLLIYCLYGYTLVDKNSWFDGIEVLIKYARSLNCHQIIAYSKSPNVIKIASKLGANTDYTLISFNI